MTPHAPTLAAVRAAPRARPGRPPATATRPRPTATRQGDRTRVVLVAAAAAHALLALGCERERYAVLLSARSQEDLESIQVTLFHLDDDRRAERSDRRVLGRTREELLEGEPVRVAIDLEGPERLMVHVAGVSPLGRRVVATRCFGVTGVVRETVMLVVPGDGVDGDGDGFSVDPGSTCFAPAGTQGEVEPCAEAYRCPADVAGDCLDEAANPASAERYPGAPEVCEDGVDQDCDGTDGACVDGDGDGYRACSPTSNPSECDCNDTDPVAHPGAEETCGDGVDQDCNGFEAPCDEDGDGSPRCGLGFEPPSCDCDDDDPTRAHTFAEVCDDGIDNDCSGRENDDVSCLPDDLDADGVVSCRVVGAPADCDCNDCDPGVYPAVGPSPGATEVCGNGVDEDCDGADAACLDTDGDGDGVGDRAQGGTDCNDDAAQTYPGAPDRCGDGVAQNCVADYPCSEDTDGDGFVEPGDCEGDPARVPWSAERCNDLDDDCDGTVDEVLSSPSGGFPNGDEGCVPDVGAAEGCLESPCVVDFRTDELHCGGCRVTCNRRAITNCVDGVCECEHEPGLGPCEEPEETCCADGCQSTDDDLLNCGDCGNVCNALAPLEGPVADACVAGSCRCGASAPCSGGEICCGGVCVDPQTDPSHCDGCGRVCDLPQTNAHACVGGVCAVSTCDAGYDDCNGLDPDGCEVPLDTLSDCSACGTVCALDHGGESCDSYSCQVVSCDALWDDCNGLDPDGCETPLTTLTDCAACSTPCARDHATPTCTTGACRVDSCDTAWGNCNGQDPDGCETSLRTLSDCGTCGDGCSTASGTASCPSGTCLIACDTDYADCNDDPRSDGCEIYLPTDVLHCGACDADCSTSHGTPSCAGGGCSIACSSGWGNCNGDARGDGCEVNTNTTVAHCGACDAACSSSHGTPSCSGGSCSIACSSGWGNCDGDARGDGCEQTLTTLTHCGACNTPCSLSNAVESCSTGSCLVSSCDSGYGNCDGLHPNGCEVNTNTTVAHCGACDAACSSSHGTPSCSGGSCSIVCSSGWGNCDGDARGDGCEQTLTTLTHCGACDTPCALDHATESCSTGSCLISSCDSGYQNCNGSHGDGCEAHLASDEQNCGGCGVACEADETCVSGICTCGTDVCESDETCESGTCMCGGPGGEACTSGEECCTDACVDTNTDPANCGSCGYVCNLPNTATHTCSGGSCGVGTCDPGYDDCTSGSGCETDILTSEAHCGGCGIACEALETCESGTCMCGSIECPGAQECCAPDDCQGTCP